MLSSELATLAGVSTRALRHYHQVGILDEPPRSSNGYRQYDVHHLIRLLQIKRLAALGIPLEDMPALLTDSNSDASLSQLLDQLDDKLTAEINMLHHQQQLVALLRSQRTPPDLPPELAPFLTENSNTNPSAEFSKMDRQHSLLLAHFAGEAGLPYILRLYERLYAPDSAPIGTYLGSRFETFNEETSRSEIDVFINEILEAYSALFREFNPGEQPQELQLPFDLFMQHAVALLNETQVRVLEMIDSRIAELNPRSDSTHIEE